jgi:MoxR-like ATPase
MRKGWNVPDDVKEDCVAQLAAIAAGAEKDSDRVAAIKALMVADSIDAKREKDESDRRLQLLELARSIPIGELAQIASSNGITIDATSQGRADEAS